MSLEALAALCMKAALVALASLLTRDAPFCTLPPSSLPSSPASPSFFPLFFSRLFRLARQPVRCARLHIQGRVAR